MKAVKILAGLLATSVATPMVAQTVEGASIVGTYKEFTDSDFDSATTTLEAGIDVSVAPQFGIGGNLSFSDGDDFAEGVSHITARGIYMVAPTSGVGGFVGLDSDDIGEVTTYGIEFATGSDTSRFEAFYGIADSDDFNDDASIAGISFEFGISGGFSVGLDYESITRDNAVTLAGETEDLTFGDTSLFARYSFADGPSVFAEVGQISASSRASDVFVRFEDEREYFAIGAEYSFGRGTGALFGDRSFLGFGG